MTRVSGSPRGRGCNLARRTYRREKGGRGDTLLLSLLWSAEKGLLGKWMDGKLYQMSAGT